MLKKIIFILLCITSQLSQAQIGEQLIKQIDKLKQGTTNVTTDIPCTQCAEQENASSAFKTCVQKICFDRGLKTSLEIPTITEQDLAKPAPNENEISTLWDEMVAIKSPSDTPEFINKVNEHLKAGKLALNKETLETFFQYAAFTVGTQSLNWNRTTYLAEFSEEKFNAIKLPFSEENKGAFKKRVKAFIEGLPPATSFSREEDPSIYLRSHYPTLKKVDAIKQLIVELKSEYQEFSKNGLGKLISQITDIDSMLPIELIEEIESGKDVSEASLRELIAAKNSFALTKMYLNSGNGTAQNEIDYEDLKNQFNSSAWIEKAIQQNQQLFNKKDSYLNDHKIECMSTYRRNLMILPSQNQLSHFKNEIKSTKKLIAKKWGSQYSIHTRKKILAYLAKVDFALPTSKEDFAAGLKNRLQRDIRKRTRITQANIKDYDSLASFYVFAAALADLQPKSESASNSTEFSDYCQQYKFDPLIDANYTMLGKIQLSYTSVLSPELGRGVLAHELGHGISEIFRSKSASDESSKKHKAYLGCLSSNHEKNGEQYNEEDYADWVAGNVTQGNFACLFRQNFTNDRKAVESEYEGDPHSGAFFRLIHIETIQKKRLPDECNKLLVEQRTPKDFLACQKIMGEK